MRMLTVKQPAHHGYQSVHDLPTPPSTSRPSPPLVYQEDRLPRLTSIHQPSSPSRQPMSGHHRGLPPPAAMTLAQPPPTQSTVAPQPPPPAGPQLGQPTALQPQPHSQTQPLGQLPAPPQWQQGPDESMRAWLQAKTEEEKTKQEEERTRQETLRLEQRRTEHEILRTSLQGGIPPPMVPVVFAGMGGSTLPQAALEWAQQYMYSQMQGQAQPHQPQLLSSTSGPVSPEHRRDSQPQAFVVYQPQTGVPPTPGSAPGFQSAYSGQAPGSPHRPRHYSLPGGRAPASGSGGLPNINTSIQGGSSAPHSSLPSGAAVQSQAQAGHSQASPAVTFHHWEPPTSHASGSGSKQPATPSERFSLVGESPRKRKATGPQPAAPPPGTQPRIPSPPSFQHGPPSSSLANPPPGRRRGPGHVRQRSDISLYRRVGNGGGRQDQLGGGYRSNSPAYSSAPATAREVNLPGDLSRQQQQHQHQYHQEQQQQQAPSQPRNAPHSVSSLLSEEPSPRNVQYHQSSAPEIERSSPTADYPGSMRQRENE
ncbi:hypothetical protein MCOR27_011696 [Pyricularia oryzae]|uniref:Uncharacterized protein n=2 Tax=Pyricularia grisea TaxID=148305 RepID=A0ABQ8N6X9_PYRGI|nr:hypothetical protein MCOR01_006348 [Pyricularia oryzae]KAI6292279.1 hypothetical protein MCOR33_009995 [Pyricularia grisea]KAH9435683.1 hypothetical protein MCOR02_004604 [Pyricularia oryzae]KAI6264521.1 hypothetical protein MCOR27_011696 [Pyricularia oryzae]KAI6268326.1 hypothetical protein MCOR34_011763 [Pyricularia oryzae]